MAMINCPECGKEVSDQAKTCPNCGVKIKKKSAGGKLAAISIICLLLLIGSCVLAYFYVEREVETQKYKTKAQAIDKKIEAFLSASSDNSLDILAIRNEYDELPENVKKYVESSKKLSEYKIEITKDNFDEFFELRADYSDMNKTSSRGWLGTEYTGHCTQTVTIVPRATFKCHDVYVSVDFNDVGLWFGRNISNVRLEDTGKTIDTKSITSTTTSINIDQPYSVSSNLSYTVEQASGYITFE